MVWAGGVNVAGSRPTGGILAQLCECVIVYMKLHIAHKIPPAGVGPETSTHAAQTATQLTKQKNDNASFTDLKTKIQAYRYRTPSCILPLSNALRFYSLTRTDDRNRNLKIPQKIKTVKMACCY